MHVRITTGFAQLLDATAPALSRISRAPEELRVGPVYAQFPEHHRIRTGGKMGRVRMSIGMMALVVVVGCAPKLAEVPTVDPTSAASIVIIHSGNGSEPAHTLLFNGQAVAMLPAGSYTQFAVQPGPHRLGVGRSVAGGLAWNAAEQMVIVDPRNTYYFLTTSSGAQRQPRIEALPADAAGPTLSLVTFSPVDAVVQ